MILTLWKLEMTKRLEPLRLGKVVMMDVRVLVLKLFVMSCILSSTSLPGTSCQSHKSQGNVNIDTSVMTTTEFPWMILQAQANSSAFTPGESLVSKGSISWKKKVYQASSSEIDSPSSAQTFNSHSIKDSKVKVQTFSQRTRNAREIVSFEEQPLSTDTHHPTRHSHSLSPTHSAHEQEINSPITHEHPTRHSHHLTSESESELESQLVREPKSEDSQTHVKTSDAENHREVNLTTMGTEEGGGNRSKQERDIPVPGHEPLKGASDISDVFNYSELMKSNGGERRTMRACRLKTYLPEFLFRVHSCAACYHYQRNVPGMFGSPSRKWGTRIRTWRSPNGDVHEIMVLANLHLNSTVMIFANSSDPSSPLLPSFANEHAKRNWLDCCEAAERCCEKMQVDLGGLNNVTASIAGGGRKTCPATWDSWQCWNETEASKTAYAPCPHYIYSVLSETSSCSLTAEKMCQEDGHWYSKPGPGHSEWTNYSNCASSVIEVQKRRTYVHVTAYGVSIIAIIPALIIFFSYKQLRVDRIILHENLFVSMLVNGIFVIAFKTIIILNELSSDSASSTTIISENGIGCRLLFILTKYSRMTNYMWMFCEGYYLHKLIASAFAEQKSLIIFYLMGWVFPIIPTVIYVSLRLAYSNERCWVVPEESFEWILNGPSLMSLLINMLFLINIIRVLVTKLRAAHANEPSQYRKAVRATLVLLPLFGLHFVVTIYRPPASGSSGTCEWLEIYFYTNDILDGVQGFLVALIFCYLNGEVTFLLRRTYTRWTAQHAPGIGCRGRNSSTRLQSRNSRGGSMLGRSVVSTQCYSSVPASPEVCCNINRLSFSSSTNQGTQQEKEKRQYSPSEKNVVIAANGTPTPRNVLNHSTSPHNESMADKMKDLNNLAPWTDKEIRQGSDPGALISNQIPPTPGTESGVFEMKPQKCVRISPTTPTSAAVKNGMKSEHQF